MEEIKGGVGRGRDIARCRERGRDIVRSRKRTRYSKVKDRGGYIVRCRKEEEIERGVGKEEEI